MLGLASDIRSILNDGLDDVGQAMKALSLMMERMLTFIIAHESLSHVWMDACKESLKIEEMEVVSLGNEARHSGAMHEDVRINVGRYASDGTRNSVSRMARGETAVEVVPDYQGGDGSSAITIDVTAGSDCRS